MKDISKAYAKSIYELGKDSGVPVADELTRFSQAINASNDLENVLFMDVFSVSEKNAVMKDVAKKLDLSSMVETFLSFLIQEKRIGLFPTIFKDVVVIDDYEQGFLRGTIEGAESKLEKALMDQIKKYLKTALEKEVRLEYQQNKKVVAGQRVTVGDFQVDASFSNQLNKLKNSILNDY